MVENKEGLILEAASSSFAMYGYKGTTMDKVAALAGIGKGTIYTAFKNKEALFDAVLQQVITEMEQVFYTNILPERSVSENLHSALYQLLAFRRDHQVMMKLANEVRMFGTDHSKRALEKVEDAIIDCLKRVLEQAQEQGKLAMKESGITAFLLYKQYMALVFDYEEKYGALGKEEIAAILEEHFIYSLIHNEKR
ncbi:TetR/AcrR family transcriptional regulator [Alteribacter natronophilus]|uniref:TetR/AcrR family transcriptional regulator n=1 Tax=Alteribacter natronophilus TaxID=2583810 RepID=UPI00110D92AD|nr:TetR/AcrR family transcriptional regulator [Alteribacter natronophilus]TMW71478.1 TetR/AcrR family transcriptional regulator [Alteribacter natronophilus]